MAKIKISPFSFEKIILNLPLRTRKIFSYPFSFLISKPLQLKETIDSIKDSIAFLSALLNFESSFLSLGIQLAQGFQNISGGYAALFDGGEISDSFPDLILLGRRDF